MPIFNAQYFEIDKSETKRYAGLRTSSFKEGIIEEACELARLIIKPTGIWNMYDYDPQTQAIGTVPPFKLEGEAIKKHLMDCNKVIIIAVTVGIEIENQITEMFKKGKYGLSIMLDAAATAAVEQSADLMEKAIKEQVSRKGYKMKWRFSPGYGDWPMEQQTEMLNHAQGEKIGITLTDSLMLEPRKSITAIIGLYSNVEKCSDIEQNKSHDCKLCNKIDCPARK